MVPDRERDDMPLWAVRMEQNLTEQLRALHDMVAKFDQMIAQVEARNAALNERRARLMRRLEDDPG